MRNMEAATVGKILVQEFISRFGVPKHLHTDQGRNFESGLIKEMCSLLGITKTRTTPYHPQSDGMIERFNRTLLNMLSTAVNKDDKSWDLQIPMLMLAYRTSAQETTKASPFSLMFGRSAQLPIDLEFNLPTETYNSPSQYQKHLREQLQQAYTTVRHHSLVEQSRQKDVYDQHVHGTTYNVGDEVWLHCPAVPRGRCRKFHRPWQGPFTIVKIIGNTVYRIQSNQSSRKRLVVHYNRLKPYFPPFNKDVFGGSQVQAQSQNDLVDNPVENLEQSLNAESEQSSNAESHVTSPTVPPVNPIPTVPEHNPPPRRSGRTRQPPDRYGTVISYPDCYPSDSDST